MLGTKDTQNNLDYLPYISSTNTKTNKTINLLIDTGANKNLISPGIIENCIPTKNKSIKNVAGTYNIKEKGKANLIGCNLPAQTYYVLKFHNFFDGLIGSEELAKNRAIIIPKKLKL